MPVPTPTRIIYGGRPCWRLANETVDLVVSPELGRIVRYGFVGTANVLWENPRAAAFAPTEADWKNWGGDKVWPWPQECWPALAGRGWPPPGDGVFPPHAALPEAKGLRLVSAEIAGLGFRVVRDIALPPTGSRVTIRSRLEATGPATANTWAAWTITQTARPDAMFARLDRDVEQSARPFEGTTPLPDPDRLGRVLHFARYPEGNAKSGMDADLLAVRLGDLLFTETVLPVGTSPGVYRPGEKAQYYMDHPGNTGRPAELPPYLEIELTSPRQPVDAAGPVLAVEWQLRRLNAAERAPATLARLIETL